MVDATNRKGAIVTRGHIKSGTVVSDRSKKTVVVEYDSLDVFPKYKRYARSKSRLPVHNPDSIGAKLGDIVEVAETRKISKTKSWIVTRILKQAAGLVVLDKKGGRALDVEADRLKKSEVKRDALPPQPQKGEKKDSD
ncbi:MAG: 30S ribosomal protein S17 [Candidatus Micrarchaeota archaeon]|nr:30S ribosomal protein S17 [Candidatus Micrarchaeota archaeon]